MSEALQYIVVCQQIWHNATGYGVNYNVDTKRLDTWQAARLRGFVVRGSDDFNIAVVRSNRLVAWQWMDEDMEEDREVMDNVARALGVVYVPDEVQTK